MTGLRERLIGSWSLESYVEIPLNGSPIHYPLGEDAQGLILYTHDGFVSAQLMRSRRKPYASGDWFRATPEELQDSSGYISYAGRYDVDEATSSLTHGMMISYFPNWIGQTQPRHVHVDGDRLRLGTTVPITSAGLQVMSQLSWRRMPGTNRSDECLLAR